MPSSSSIIACVINSISSGDIAILILSISSKKSLPEVPGGSSGSTIPSLSASCWIYRNAAFCFSGESCSARARICSSVVAIVLLLMRKWMLLSPIIHQVWRFLSGRYGRNNAPTELTCRQSYALRFLTSSVSLGRMVRASPTTP